MAPSSKTYTAKDIIVLEGLEPVRRRPGMYIGGVDSTGLHHLLWEIVDNCVDEAMNGHADRINVTLHADGDSATVSDNGRGIPVDRHAQYKKPALELILTTLHAGGKFEAKNYYHSGGLHGVGASVVTALSESLVARVRRDGAEWEQKFARGKAVEPAQEGRRGARQRHDDLLPPDPKIFPSVRLRSQTDRRAARGEGVSPPRPHGRVPRRVDGRERDLPLRRRPDGVPREDHQRARQGADRGRDLHDREQEDDLQLDCALAWTDATEERVLSFVNGIPTSAGGAHENGLRAGLVKAVRNYLTVHNAIPRGLTITAEDVREGMVAILSIKIPQPQFQGQTKERLNNPEVTPAIDGIVRTALENALQREPHRRRRDRQPGRPGVAGAERVARGGRAGAAQERRLAPPEPPRQARRLQRRPTRPRASSSSSRATRPAARPSRAATATFQAILPLRGKVLNTEQASTSKVLGNKELADIVSALGCGAGKDLDAKKLRYHKICLLMDADSDGHHICTLLLTFFYRHLLD